jgi:hypothetical protein
MFISTVTPGEPSISALLLAESIRAFAGKLADAPIRFYVTPEGKIPDAAEKRLRALGVELRQVKVDPKAASIFFMPQLHAAAEAEKEAKEETLIWLGANTLVLHEPKAFVLPPGKSLGYRPVHITNIGSKWGTPLDAFWSLIYRHCGVDKRKVSSVKTHVDGNTLRFYINAAHIVVRPERRFMGAWLDKFESLYMHPDFTPFYADERYRIFMHQAIFSALTTTIMPREELLELPSTYNYPSHLYDEDKSGAKPTSIDDLVTVRHEGFFEEPDWEEKMPAGAELKAWLREKMRL